ncbi:hypothetical protein Pmani_025478, partial [Petrolisthes manimaculis]
ISHLSISAQIVPLLNSPPRSTPINLPEIPFYLPFCPVPPSILIFLTSSITRLTSRRREGGGAGGCVFTFQQRETAGSSGH